MAAYAKKGNERLLEDARHALQEPAGARPPVAREVRQGSRPRRRATSRTRSTARSTTRGIEADSAEGTKFGARGTPAFFINGRPLSGAQPFDAFKKVIDEELANADKAMSRRRQAGQRLRRAHANGKQARRAARRSKPAQPQPAQADPNAVYKVPVGNSPEKGPKTAKVTIVQFSDFQCPFCSRVEPTITDLEKDYGKDVRVVWKNNPLPFHQNAMPAAKAAMAAGAAGQVLGDARQAVRRSGAPRPRRPTRSTPSELGLNMSKFKAAMADREDRRRRSRRTRRSPTKLRRAGTPGFFINGRPLRGAQPKEPFKAVIDKEIEAADAALKTRRQAGRPLRRADQGRQGQGRRRGAGAAPQRPQPGAAGPEHGLPRARR